MKEGRAQWGWLGGIVDPIRLDILLALSDMGEATAAELEQRIGAPHQTAARHVRALIDLGIILRRAGESDGRTPGRPAARFRLAPEVRQFGDVLRSIARGAD